MPFDPDQYLSEKGGSSSFNPDSYLQEKTGQTQPQQPQGMMDKVSGAMNMAKSNPAFAYSPQGILTNGFEGLQRLAGKAGEYVTDATTKALNQPNASITPESWKAPLAAGAGTAVAMAPDVFMSAVNPEEGLTQTPQNEYAQTKGLQAMGAPKRIFKTPESTNAAMGHSQTLLDQGLIKPFRGAEGMADNLTNLESSSGQKISDILGQFKDQGKFYDPEDAVQKISALRPFSKSSGQFLTGGAYDTINNKIDNAIATIRAHAPQGGASQTMGFDEANQLKGTLQGLANYGSNKDATLLDKVIAGKFRESLDGSLDKASQEIGDPQLSQEFQNHKKIYASTQFAKDPVYNKLSSELANKGISLTDWILGAHSIAAGNPLAAVAEVGAKKLFEKFGNSTQAYVSNQLSKTPELIGSANKAVGADKALSLFDKGGDTGTPNQGKVQSTPNPSSKPGNIPDRKSLFQRMMPATPFFNKSVEKKPSSPDEIPPLTDLPDDPRDIEWMVSQPNKSDYSPVDFGNQKHVAKKILDERSARIYLDKANGNKEKAREMAIQDGWRIS